jgi:nucleotide-binding universal stress UspA family protein
MRVVLWYAPTTEGRAALDHAVAEAAVKASRLVVVPEDGALVAEAESLAAARGVAIELRSPAGGRTVADELMDLSYDEDVASLVIGVRRRSPVGKLILGSTAQKLILEAGCPVVAIKPPVEARES